MKIQDLTDKIYRDGIEKAKTEERALLDNARRESVELLEAARKEAAGIVETARKEAERVKERLDAEAKGAAAQALSLLKQHVADLLAESVLTPAVHEAAADPKFIQTLIVAVVEKWNATQTKTDLTVVLPDRDKTQLEEFFKAKAAGLLAKGLRVTFQSRMPNGFLIGPSDNSFKLSFTETDFVEFFKSFLRQKTKEILFPGRHE